MNYYFKVLKNYATFSGRARRSEYWLFVLFNMIFLIVLSIAGVFIAIPEISYLYFLLLLIPSIAVGVRRMHDVGKSGWFLLVPIYSFILTVIEGDKGDNQYGSDPKTE